MLHVLQKLFFAYLVTEVLFSAPAVIVQDIRYTGGVKEGHILQEETNKLLQYLRMLMEIETEWSMRGGGGLVTMTK